MAVVLGLAMFVNVCLLVIPLLVGSPGDSAVAAVAEPPVTMPAIHPPTAKATTARKSSATIDSSPSAPSPMLVVPADVQPLDPPAVVVLSPGELPAADSPAEPVTSVARDDAANLPPVASPADDADPPPASVTLIPVPAALPAPMPDFDPSVLELFNPPETNGPVHFVVDGTVYSLQAGEKLDLVAASQRKVEFHRGDDFGDIAYQVERGTWCFQVTDAGWELVEAEHVSKFVQP
jgi:hypothetical protein